jgi:signal transduction histidine kinase
VKQARPKRDRYIPKSLFWRISLIFLFLIAVIGLSYVYITVHFSSVYFQKVNQRLNRAVASNIIANSSPFLNKKINQPGLQNIFHSVMDVNPGLEVYLLDTQGKILSYFAPDKKIVLKQVDLGPVKKFIQTKGEHFMLGDDPRHKGIRKVFSAAPVMNDGNISGYMYVVLASEDYDSASRFLLGGYIMQVGYGTMILTLLATVIFGLIIIWVTTKNFSRIIEVMQKFREGDLTARVLVRSTGDIRQLADIFNEMADILTSNLEKLKEVEVLRRELIANVSHDLRTPISIINGYLETMQMKSDALPDHDRKRYMNIILESTGKLEKLVNELFELSKLEANQVKPHHEPFFISELVSDISNKYHFIANDKNITINTVLSKDLPPVFADVSLIERVIQNLLDNAIKFTPKGGNVVIQTSKGNNGKVEVTLSDTGVGIPESDREKIFNRYYRVDSFYEFRNSAGLGLAIVKKILDLHNSSLFINTIHPAGTSFVFHLHEYKGALQ